MYKILISGYYGFNNIGDESILKAVVGSLKKGLSADGEVRITVLSKDPEGTKARYAVESANRKSVPVIIKEVAKCDLLISGGGSLLQDVTSRKSILYYLFIMWLARLFGKDYFVYSQGIGPINSGFNRRLTARILKHAAGIAVRDEASAEFLKEIGIPESKVAVTADPVLSLPPADKNIGREILIKEGLDAGSNEPLVGFAIREKKTDSDFVDELAKAIKAIVTERGCKAVLIPFFYNEDMAVLDALRARLAAEGLSDRICAVSHKYLSGEMMSIIGNMDILVGVRLHSLIHAAIMGVPMIGISYDPKINSFMKSLGLRAISSVYDFTAEYFMEEFDKTWNRREEMKNEILSSVEVLKKKLDTNEEMILKIKDRR